MGSPRITAISFSFRLMETVCQLSYPLNSENASPFGTRTVYLAWPVSCAEVALLPRTASTERASDSTTITTAGILLLFIASPRCLLVASMGLTVRRSLARMAGRVKHYGTVTGRRRLCFSISATRSRRRSVGLSVHAVYYAPQTPRPRHADAGGVRTPAPPLVTRSRTVPS